MKKNTYKMVIAEEKGIVSILYYWKIINDSGVEISRSGETFHSRVECENVVKHLSRHMGIEEE